MLRHPRPLLRALLLGCAAAALAGCGIKGPLAPPPKPDAAAAKDEAAKGGARPAPRL
ncbi:MAG: hypothetical protein KJ018_11960 [Burkholderiales bacterium]|nr:hypothetical protein [Burkholderiales bacterium]GIK88394.1 MAG: hypothetical protein BroJett026_38750 [Betaproteobacteria bacterium]